MSMQPLAFINARLVDPETGYDGPGALLTVDGTIAEVRRDGAFPGLSPDTRVIDADGAMLCPGLVDIRVKTGAGRGGRRRHLDRRAAGHRSGDRRSGSG